MNPRRRWAGAVLLALLAGCQTAPPPPPHAAAVVLPPPVAEAAAEAAGHRPGAGRRCGARLCPHRRDPGAGRGRHPPGPGHRHLGRQPGGGAVCLGQERRRAGHAGAVDGRRRHHRLVVSGARADPRRGAGALRARTHRRQAHRADEACRWASSPPTWTAARASSSASATPAWRCVPPARCRRCSSRCASARASIVDGGLVAPVPVRYARQMGAQLVIAVDISEAPDGAATGDAMRMLLQTFSIMGRSINQFELARGRHRAAPQAGGRVRRRLQRRAPAPSRPAATRRRPCWANCGCASWTTRGENASPKEKAR